MKKYIPDFITSLNLLCGSVGVVFALDGKLDLAFYAMIAAAVFDFCDGLAARLLGAYSDLGKELDSLSDVVSFGVLPSMMLVVTMRQCSFSSSIVSLVPVIIAVATGFRLAKFNVDDRQHSSFLGLPSPASALLAASLSYYIALCPGSFLSIWASGPVFIPAVSVVLSALLVCEIPMFSLKVGNGIECGRNEASKRLAMAVECAAIVVFVAAFKMAWPLAVLAAMVLYVLKNCIYAIFRI